MHSGGPKEAQVQSYLPGGANVPFMWAYWRHLADRIEPSICGGDAVLCQGQTVVDATLTEEILMSFKHLLNV